MAAKTHKHSLLLTTAPGGDGEQHAPAALHPRISTVISRVLYFLFNYDYIWRLTVHQSTKLTTGQRHGVRFLAKKLRFHILSNKPRTVTGESNGNCTTTPTTHLHRLATSTSSSRPEYHFTSRYLQTDITPPYYIVTYNRPCWQLRLNLRGNWPDM
jgi:hypothetical protein